MTHTIGFVLLAMLVVFLTLTACSQPSYFDGIEPVTKDELIAKRWSALNGK